MKKTKDFYAKLFLRKKGGFNFNVFLFFAVLFLSILYSCASEEEEIISASGESKTKIESEITKKVNNVDLPFYVEENLTSFSEQVFVNTKSLETAINKNAYVGFNAQTMQLLNVATTESDLKAVFEMAGISNSQEVIDILKSNVAAQQAFITGNPAFYNLSVEKQIEILNASIELAKTTYSSQVPLPITEVVGAPDCASNFNKTIDRCAGDFGVCAVFAVAGAYAGLAPGLLAAAYCMVTKINCDSRAKNDYKECVIKPFNLNGPQDPTDPPTGEVTVHCVRDSCWTTDSNGKFIERID